MVYKTTTKPLIIFNCTSENQANILLLFWGLYRGSVDKIKEGNTSLTCPNSLIVREEPETERTLTVNSSVHS